MRRGSLVFAVGVFGCAFGSAAGCVGGPGDGLGGDAGKSGNDASSSSSSSSGSSSGTTTGTRIEASDFDKTCGTAADCVAIVQGDVCSPCACPNEAIARAASQSYTSAVTSARASCPKTDTIVACAECPNATAVCANGKCSVAIGVPSPDGG